MCSFCLIFHRGKKEASIFSFIWKKDLVQNPKPPEFFLFYLPLIILFFFFVPQQPPTRQASNNNVVIYERTFFLLSVQQSTFLMFANECSSFPSSTTTVLPFSSVEWMNHACVRLCVCIISVFFALRPRRRRQRRCPWGAGLNWAVPHYLSISTACCCCCRSIFDWLFFFPSVGSFSFFSPSTTTTD